MKYPYCKSTGHQIKVWFTAAGRQHYLCKQCQRKYVADPKERGYSEKMRSEVMRLYLEGKGFYEIGRTLNVNYQTLANWVNTYYAAQLPPSSMPKVPKAGRVNNAYLRHVLKNPL